ncbi:Plant invertase/pectin methylesterase inhibitor superfamily protein [Euphorbia peplus]|nr:Plant invertase/pectin methylesterase inhibitor superfamily protein [Euphorbia peplus]
MQIQMPNHRLLLPLLFIISLRHLRSTPATGQLTNEDYLRRSCNTTLYPDICYSSLSPYARNVKQNPLRLIRVSLSVLHSKATPLTAYISSLFRRGTPDARLYEALDQCNETLDSAIDEMEDSLQQMRNMRTPQDMDNVQTWMSGALTNAETCIEGLEGVSNGPDKLEVIRRTTEVLDFTSVVLAFVADMNPPPSTETGLTPD